MKYSTKSALEVMLIKLAIPVWAGKRVRQASAGSRGEGTVKQALVKDMHPQDRGSKRNFYPSVPAFQWYRTLNSQPAARRERGVVSPIPSLRFSHSRKSERSTSSVPWLQPENLLFILGSFYTIGLQVK